MAQHQLDHAPFARPEHVQGAMGVSNTHIDARLNVVHPLGPSDVVWEIDAYRTEGANGQPLWNLVMCCPRCGQPLRVDSTRKKIEIDKYGRPESEVFACTHEQDGRACGFVGRLAPAKSPKEVMVIEDAVTRQRKRVRIHGYIHEER